MKIKAKITQLFSAKTTIDVDLKGHTLKDVLINLVPKNKKKRGGFYIDKTINENQIFLAEWQEKRDLESFHIVEYFSNDKIIKITSEYTSFVIWFHISLILPICFLVFFLHKEYILSLMVLNLAFFIFKSIILIVGIKSESKDLEREVILRINHSRNKYN